MSTHNPQSLTSDQIMQLIKKKPYTQMLDDVELTYSVLSKKQEGFVLTNDRFLLLKGNQSISYARSLLAGTPLPFRHYSSIPEPKATFLLSDIETFTNEQQKLIIVFSSENRSGWSLNCSAGREQRIKWEFSCPSKVCALQWKRKLQAAISNAQDFKKSRYQKYNDILSKRYQKDLERTSIQKKTNSLLAHSKFSQNSPSAFYQPQFKTQSNTSFQYTNQTQNPPDFYFEKVEPVSSKQKDVEYSNTPQKSVALMPAAKPSSFLYKGPQLAKIQELFLQNSKPMPLISRSMRNISQVDKQKMREQVMKFRRNWIDELIAGQQQSELFLDFQIYIRKVADIIVSELYLPIEQKIFPEEECLKDYASYELEDVYLEVYFYSEDNIERKHHRYKQSVREFKNLDYLAEVTQNKGVLKVPFMVLFEFKGFLGMAKTKIPSDQISRNQQLTNLVDISRFRANARINPELLLDQSSCKIVLYRKHKSSTKLTYVPPKVYFVQRLTQFLPFEDSANDYQQRVSANLLRPELIQDQKLSELIFFDKKSRNNHVPQQLLQQKINLLLQGLQNHTQYFTNSKELSELLHLSGISVRHLGVLFQRTQQRWLKGLLQAEIAARCLKAFYRFDLQNCILLRVDRMPPKQRQEERQKKRVLSLLNLLLGNTEPTFRLWRNLNIYSKKHFKVAFWNEDYSAINIGYFIQAIQTHLKIILSQNVLNKLFFKSMSSLQDSDFVCFELEVTGYNLDFTQTFSQINACLQQENQNRQSFVKLSQTISRVTKSGKTFLQLTQKHSIYQKINQFLLNFVSPDAKIQLYDKIQTEPLPSKFMYESKFAQIKWYLMYERLDCIDKPVNFLKSYLTKWLGPVHPIYAQLNHLLAEYFVESPSHYSRALEYARDSLQMQISLFGEDRQNFWKDYFLVGKIQYLCKKYQDAVLPLKRAQKLVEIGQLLQFQIYGQLMLTLSRCQYTLKYFKDSYSTAKKLYQVIKSQKDEVSLINILEAVQLIKQLLEVNQEHQSYYRFVESDFGNILPSFTQNPPLYVVAVQLIALPHLKNILQHTKHRPKLINIIQQLTKIVEAQYSSMTFLRSKTKDLEFPRIYLQHLREVDAIIEEIWSNQMLTRWMSFNNMSNKTLLSKIGSSQLNRGFELLAYLTAILNLLGPGITNCLFMMQN